MFYIKLLISSLLLLLFISGCGKKVDSNKDCNNRSSVVEKVSDKEKKSDKKDVPKAVLESTKEVVTSEKNASKVSVTNVKLTNKVGITNAKLALLNRKLYKCGVNYVSWKDRLSKDRILLPKVLKVCSKVKQFTKNYILHTTKVKRKKGFIKGYHIYIPYNWSTQQIVDYLKIIPKQTFKKSNKKDILKLAKNGKLGNSNSVVKIETNRVVEVGNPYFITE